MNKSPNLPPTSYGVERGSVTKDCAAYLKAVSNYKAAAKRAIEIDDSLAEAHTSLAVIKHCFDWDWEGSEQEFKRAIELDPKYATAFHKYGWCLVINGRTEEAVAVTRRAHEIDPLSLIISTRIGTFLYYARKYGQAIEQCKKVLDMEPNFSQALLFLGLAYEQKGDFEKAVLTLRRAVKLSKKAHEMMAALGCSYASAGRQPEAIRILSQLQNQAEEKDGFISPYYIASLYTALGKYDEAFSWLERAVEEKEEQVTYLKVNPAMDPLRKDARFQNLLHYVRIA